MKTLVTYFSASGVTAKVAQKLASAIDAPLYEIKPEKEYSSADLDWTNGQSRSSIEMQNKSYRVKLANTDAPVAEANIIFIGYPVWWYREPSIIDSFLDAYNFSGKKIVLFVTSGGSDVGAEAPKRIAEISGTDVIAGKRFSARVSEEELKSWAESLINI